MFLGDLRYRARWVEPTVGAAAAAGESAADCEVRRASRFSLLYLLFVSLRRGQYFSNLEWIE